jgi:hypothetical protein
LHADVIQRCAFAVPVGFRPIISRHAEINALCPVGALNCRAEGALR